MMNSFYMRVYVATNHRSFVSWKLDWPQGARLGNVKHVGWFAITAEMTL